ncbi:MAG: hypothetical protein AMJ84_04790 [Acidithiobacillales bacterium SM23_46]|nr:MAG: hypothetical protein AMJ84_04790 [Acidithiobacillales bacterium SM23_46]
MRRILAELAATEGVLGSALLGLDGMVIVDNFVVEVNLEKLGALLSKAYNTLQQVFGGLEQGTVGQAWFETERRSFFIQAVAVGLLVVVARQDAPVGLIRLDMRKAILQLETGEKKG